MLDLHVLTHHNNPEWDAQCRRSIAAAVVNAPFPVAVHFVEGIEGHIGRGRARGYSLGEHPYVTYVDHDDYLLIDALEALWPAMQDKPDAIFPGELELQNGFLRIGQKRHHLCVYKREHIIDHAQFVVCGDIAQAKALDGKHCIDLKHRGYIHRVYESAGRILRRANNEEHRRVANG